MECFEDEFTPSDFKASETNRIRCRKDGFRQRPGAITDFEWKDYCPSVFRKLQEFENMDYDDYMLSVCTQNTIREICASRKAGTVVCVGDNGQLVVKTVKKSETKVLLDMLPKYYQHIKKYGGSTLLIKLYGLHVIRPIGALKVYIIVMSNVVQSDLYLHKMYDLKGSLQGRNNKEVVNDRTIFKDSDLDFCFYLEPSVQQRLMEQMKLDCEFLEDVGIMDYSLLLGMHIEASDQASFDDSPSDHKRDSDKCPEANDRQSSPSSHEHPGSPGNKLGVKMQAQAVRKPKNEIGGNQSSGFRGMRPHEPHNVLLYFGIVDILQSYNMVKRLEHCYKSIQYDSKSITAVNAKVYSSRFLEFISRIFLAEDPNSPLLSSPASCKSSEEVIKRQDM